MGTRLGLAGVPRRSPLWKFFGAPGGVRPDKKYSRLGPTGTPRRLQTFTEKLPAGGGGTVRPAGRYSSLGLSGAIFARRKAFVPKAGAVGIAGTTTLTLTPQATITIGRRRSVTTDLVLSIRPIGAVITVAHTSHQNGRTTLSLTPVALMRYTKSGRHYAFQGNNSITITPFGAVRYRYRRSITGGTTLTLIPGGTRVYTPAPIRNHHIAGRSTISLTPAAAISQAQGGQQFSFVGTNFLEFGVFGRMAVTRATTHLIHGRTTLTLTPQATITKGSGPPVAYYIYASTTLTLTPHGLVRYNLGDFKQNHISGRSLIELLMHGRVTVRRAPSVTAPPLGAFRRGDRRFIRLFRGKK